MPLTDEVIRKHLAGEITAGIYPLLSDETCWFLAVDFDKKTWQLDAAAFLATCHAMGVPAALERSRSGRGGHVWIFFESAIPAATARKLGCSLLTRTMECRHQVGLDSYDRLFPNQDTMPKGGLGNLIALPLQKLPREVLLTGRTEHLKYFAARLQGAVKNVFVLKGGMGKRQRQSVAEALAQVPENEPRVILATGSYLGEGFDDARLDTLFLALPISWRGTLQQYVGRLHRIHDNKRVVEVYDYVDADVPVLARMYERRLKGYAAIGYTLADQVSNTHSPTTSVGH